MGVDPQDIARLITENPDEQPYDGPYKGLFPSKNKDGISAYLNSNNIVPECTKGQVTLERYTGDDNYIPLTPDELRSIGFSGGYVQAHPQGSPRGGYVPTVHTVNGSCYYDENADEWYDI